MTTNLRLVSAIATCALLTAFLAPSVRAARPRQIAPQSAPAAASPQPAALPKRAEEVRRRVEKIGVGQRITVVRFDGIEHYGTVRALGATSVEVAEVDIKQPVTDAYVDIKKVRKGYGGINWVSGKRPNPVWGWVAAAAIFVPLLISLKSLD
jgi:hypothetical protein